MNIYGFPIVVDPSLLDDKIKFVHPDGDEQVFGMDGNEVIEGETVEGSN